MNNLNKLQAKNEWLAANPGKTERDWLLDVGCPDEKTREAAANLLDTLEKGNVTYGICVEVPNHYPKYQEEPLLGAEELYFDLMIAPGDVNGCSYIFEMDIPDEILGQLTSNSKNEFIPEEGYKWLLRQWFPDFDFSTLDEKQMRKLLWADLGGLLVKYQGDRGFPNWKTADFATALVEKVAALRKANKD